jgi:hypothetical protein
LREETKVVLESGFPDNLPQDIVILCPGNTQQVVNLGTGGGDEGLKNKGDQSDEVADECDDDGGPPRFPVLLFPEFGVLQVLVAEGGDLHSQLEAVFELHAVEQLNVLRVLLLDKREELLVELW